MLPKFLIIPYNAYNTVLYFFGLRPAQDAGWARPAGPAAIRGSPAMFLCHVPRHKLGRPGMSGLAGISAQQAVCRAHVQVMELSCQIPTSPFCHLLSVLSNLVIYHELRDFGHSSCDKILLLVRNHVRAILETPQTPPPTLARGGGPVGPCRS